MRKLIKYELRKDMILYIIVFSVIMMLEFYLLGSILAKSEANIVISTLLFIMCGSSAILLVEVLGVVSFARELGSKYSYMTFMTPNSTFKIVGAKYITLLIITTLLTAIFAVSAVADVRLALYKYDSVNDFIEMVDFILEMGQTSISEIVLGFAISFLIIWLDILTTVSFAYLAITLSATILSNKRGKGWLAVGLFIGIRIITSVIKNFIPVFEFGDTFLLMLAGQWMTFVFEILLVVGTYFGVSIMLDKKVSL